MTLTVKNLSKSYRSLDGRAVAVLRDISFSVAAGEAAGITGVSGSGKSTLLHLLGGLEACESGSILVNDFTVTKASTAALNHWRNQNIGFVFQFHHLLPDLTASENVALPLLIRRLARSESMRRALDVLERVGLLNVAERRVVELSGGEQQRVAIARAVVTEPQLILADEPTGNLDYEAARRCGELLIQLARSGGAAVVLATHNESLAAMCDRVLRLEAGQVNDIKRAP